jgi:hypothetical protein
MGFIDCCKLEIACSAKTDLFLKIETFCSEPTFTPATAPLNQASSLRRRGEVTKKAPSRLAVSRTDVGVRLKPHFLAY